jgi:hypothetical protein
MRIDFQLLLMDLAMPAEPFAIAPEDLVGDRKAGAGALGYPDRR